MIQTDTLRFLRALKPHNNKTWFDANRPKYLAAKEDFEQLVARVLQGFEDLEPEIAQLSLKDCVFRIYKDVRFSKDRTPYKTHFAASFSRGGKKVHFPGYYLHIEPDGNSFLGGGMWMPAAPELKKIRQEIDYHLKEWEGLLLAKGFQKLYGGLSEEDMLSRPPQGYTADNPAVEYLKRKSFIAGCNLSDEVLQSKKALKEIMHRFETLKPLIDFLNRALD